MKKFSSSFYWFSANLCSFFGFTATINAYAAVLEAETIFKVTAPIAISSLYMLFPFVTAFILIIIVGQIRKNLRSEFDILEALRFFLNIHKMHLITCVFLLISSTLLLKNYQIGGVTWAFGTPFEREHAISLGATASLFYAIIIPLYSHKSTEGALFDNES